MTTVTMDALIDTLTRIDTLCHDTIKEQAYPEDYDLYAAYVRWMFSLIRSGGGQE